MISIKAGAATLQHAVQVIVLEELRAMDAIDVAFLTVVLIAFGGFVVSVAYGNWVTGGDKGRG